MKTFRHTVGAGSLTMCKFWPPGSAAKVELVQPDNLTSNVLHFSRVPAPHFFPSIFLSNYIPCGVVLCNCSVSEPCQPPCVSIATCRSRRSSLLQLRKANVASPTALCFRTIQRGISTSPVLLRMDPSPHVARLHARIHPTVTFRWDTRKMNASQMDCA